MKNYAPLVSCSTTKIWRAHLPPILKRWNRIQGILEFGRDLWRSYMESNTSAEAESTTASCSGLCPIRFCVTLKTGTLQWSRAACSSTQSPLHRLRKFNIQMEFPVFQFVPCISVECCPSTAHHQDESLMPSSLLPDRH